MTGNRRDFLKATAVMSAVGASNALAQQPQQPLQGPSVDIPWIGLLHSTALEHELELNFLDGLRQQNWEGDPIQMTTGRKQVIIRKIHGNGRYRANNFDNLKLGLNDLRTHTSPNLKLLVASGGLVSGLAAAQVPTMGIPVLVVLGRANQALQQSADPKFGGYFFDYPIGEGQNQNLMKKVTYLNTHYGVSFDKMCLLYNGNSNMGSAELADWQMANSAGKWVDAAQGDENRRVNFKKAFDEANARLGNGIRAILVSADPFFTMRRARIMRLAQRSATGLIMCYPLSEYYDDAIESEIDNTTFMSFGPGLKDVYTNLGSMAGQILTNPITALSITQAQSNYRGI